MSESSTENGGARRVAIPSQSPGGLGAHRSAHFGHCECFTVVDVNDGSIGEVTIVANAPPTRAGA